MKLLSLSGGSTKGVGMLGVLSQLDYKPDIIAGVSIGSILALPYALGKLEQAKKIGLNLKTKDFWDISPFSFKAFLRVITGKHSLGIQNIRRLMSMLITKEDYTKYLAKTKYPSIYVLAINLYNGDRLFKNLKNCTYDQAMDLIAASSAINIMTMPVKIDGEYYVDGGFRDHSPGNVFLQMSKEGLVEEITEVVSVYSRPNKPYQRGEWWNINNKIPIKGLLNAVRSSYNLLNIGVSKDDSEREIMLCKQQGIPLKQYFLPYVLKGLYDTDNKRLTQLYEIGKNVKPIIR